MAYLNGKKITLNPKFLGISDISQLYKYLGDKVEKEDGTPASIEDVVSLIEEINNVGVEALKSKGIVILPGFNMMTGQLPITTLQVMEAIENTYGPFEVKKVIEADSSAVLTEVKNVSGTATVKMNSIVGSSTLVQLVEE